MDAKRPAEECESLYDEPDTKRVRPAPSQLPSAEATASASASASSVAAQQGAATPRAQEDVKRESFELPPVAQGKLSLSPVACGRSESLARTPPEAVPPVLCGWSPSEPLCARQRPRLAHRHRRQEASWPWATRSRCALICGATSAGVTTVLALQHALQ